MRVFYRSMTAVLEPRFLPLGIPLYVLLFAEIYLLFIPKSPMMDTVVFDALIVAPLCFPFMWFTPRGSGLKSCPVAEGISREGDILF